MFFFLRLLVASLRGMLERLAFRLVAFSVALVCLLVLVALVATLAGRALVSHAERRADTRWRQTLKPLLSLPETEPPRGANPQAAGLEALAAEMGINLVPLHRGRKKQPDPETAAQFQVFAEILEHWAALLIRSGAELPPVPPDLSRLLTENRDRLDQATTLLSDEVPPRWECDVTAGYQAPLPNLAGQLQLQQLLMADASQRRQRGDVEGAAAVLDASWRLNQPTLSRPERACVPHALEALKMQLAVLHGIKPPPAAWQQRLADLDVADRYLHTLRTEAFAGLQAARSGLAANRDSRWWRFLFHPLLQPLERWTMLHHAEALRLAVEELPGRDMRRFDPGEYAALLEARIPRWNVPARLVLPDAGGEWQQVVHAALGLELARTELKLHELAAAGEIDALVDLAGVHPSALSGFAWRFRLEPNRLIITLAGGAWAPPDSGFPALPLETELTVPGLPGAKQVQDAA